MKMKSLFISMVMGVFILLLVACGGAATPEPVNITIEMSEFAYNPDHIELQVGQEATFTLVNKGALEHEIMIGRNVMMMDDHPSGYKVDMFESANVEPTVKMAMPMDMADEEEEGHEGFMVHLPVGSDTATMTFTVTKDMVGEWEIGCFEQDGVHYTAGMVGSLVVTP